MSELKIDPDMREIPIITFTGSIEGEKLISKGWVDDYITKPFDEKEISATIKSKLKGCKSAIRKEHHHKKTSVLMIDDEEDVRRIVELSLRPDGFEVYTAEDGPAGIEAACKHKPKVILLDVMMPEMDGLEVLMKLKWDKKLKKIPVIMLTAKSTVGDMDQAFSKNADGYITKPFDGETLGNTIREKLEEMKENKSVVNS